MADLPPTFRDAVSAVRRLGLRYLWIDSLCILQDSDEDWRREAGRMQNVYRNAYCNLAASGSHNVLGGLIKTRDPTLIFPCVVSFASNLHSEEEWLIIPENWWESFTETRLNRRGWIVQERLLAARVIHFGSDQLHWECHELDACESFPNGIPLSGSLRSTAYKGIDPATDGVRLRARYGRLAQDDTGLEALYLWSRVISLYTDCQLTKESDKLIALAGLAGQFSTLMPEAQYLAGLWSTHLACQLLWSVDVLNDKPAAKYPAAYRAPSWSWAAVDAHIEPATITSQGILIEIKQFTIIPSPPDSLDTMFQVSSGSLTIQGNLVKAQQKITPRRSPWTSEILQSIILDSSTPIPRVSANFDVLDVILAHTSSLPHSQASSSFFFLLPVRKYVYAATHWVAGLILVDVNDKPIANASNSAGTKDRAGKAEDKKKGVYRRVGKFTTSGKGAESFIELVENSGNQGNGSTEEEKDGEDTLGTFILQ
ncbi:hypothetical protein H2198_006175 [Neophaeococcomyces mojaviensis]|uniref:Uncharacterized protein n=1 Tax=Neophaeococcomyces mojaviensis TaxID=3383035 RepID=A0ACC3A3J0_9EURO|nr:hypothetical protein H2198_006175 [Knufia sp. JES_112]